MLQYFQQGYYTVMGGRYITEWAGGLAGFLFRSHFNQKFLDFSAYMPKFSHSFI